MNQKMTENLFEQEKSNSMKVIGQFPRFRTSGELEWIWVREVLV